MVVDVGSREVQIAPRAALTAERKCDDDEQTGIELARSDIEQG